HLPYRDGARRGRSPEGNRASRGGVRQINGPQGLGRIQEWHPVWNAGCGRRAEQDAGGALSRNVRMLVICPRSAGYRGGTSVNGENQWNTTLFVDGLRPRCKG